MSPSTWALAVHSRRRSLSGNRAVLRRWPLPLAYPIWRPRSGGIGFQQQTYSDLQAAEGRLAVAEGLRVQPASALWESVREHWGAPVKIVCDRFRIGELQDAVQGASVR